MDKEEGKMLRAVALCYVVSVVLILLAIVVSISIICNAIKSCTTSGDDGNYVAVESHPTITDTPELVPDFPEDPNEQDNIYAALLEIGYLRDDVPLSYELQDALRTACDVYGVEYCLALGMIEYESNFQEDCVSSAGCYGLMQLNPKYFPSGLDSVDNVMYGVEYFAKCLESNDYDVSAALRAYNRGYDDGHRVYANNVLEYANKWREGETYAVG